MTNDELLKEWRETVEEFESNDNVASVEADACQAAAEAVAVCVRQRDALRAVGLTAHADAFERAGVALVEVIEATVGRALAAMPQRGPAWP